MSMTGSGCSGRSRTSRSAAPVPVTLRSGPGCGLTLRVDQKGNCTIPVTFTPSAAGNRTAMLTVVASVVTFDPLSKDTRTYTANLSGTGITPVTSIVIDPAAESHVFPGLDGAGIFRSTDRGGSWSPATMAPVTTGSQPSSSGPVTAPRLYAATYSGVYRSTDSGASWAACANTGLTNLNVLSLAMSPAGTLYPGTENGVFTSTDNCASWTAMSAGLPS